MAAILGSFGAALRAAREGMSANAFYRQLQDLGVGARRSEVLALYRTALNVVWSHPEEVFRPQDEIPSGSDIALWPTRREAGVAQTVTLAYRDRITGQIKQTWWTIKTESGIARETAIAQAIDAYSEHAESYEQDLIGAVHTSSYRYSPGLV